MAWRLKVNIESNVLPKTNSEDSKVIVTFVDDPHKSKHEVYFFDFCPFQKK